MNLTVTTKNGVLEGFSEDGIRKFFGIPYAAAPVGENRFRRTRPAQNWGGTLKATEFGPKCPQLAIPINPDDGKPQDEDCLYMNIWAPAEGENLPVMVWTYGGSFSSGAGSDDLYDGSNYVKRGDVILVTFNYRVGMFGTFYDMSKFSALDGKYDANAGLYDVIEALTWVQNNIAAFGGDPDNVTIFGESAGANLTAAVYAIPQTAGLYSKAILESYVNTDSLKNPEADNATDFIKALGLDESNADEMLTKSTEEILAGFSAMCGGNILTAGAGIVNDGYYVCEGINELLAKRGGSKKLLTGNNKDEAVIFLPPHEGWNDELEAMKNGMTQKFFVKFNNEYARTAQATDDVWMYRFDYAPIGAQMSHMGAFHSAEMIYVFGNFNVGMAAIIKGCEEQAAAVSGKMMDAWISFAKTGDPGWDKADNDLKPVYLFD